MISLTKTDRHNLRRKLINTGWKTLIIRKHAKLSLDNSRVRLEYDDGEAYVPLCQIREIIIETAQCNITSALLAEMTMLGIGVIVCDSKHNPCGTFNSLGTDSSFPGRIMDQAQWSADVKDTLWQKIIENKVNNQIDVLKRKSFAVPDELYCYYDDITPGDIHNMEGQAARLYFNTLFGQSFNRRKDDNINSMLNYGYSIILSGFNRIITMHGFSTVLGINHHSRSNPFNFACDLMEPFRPMVDELVYSKLGNELDVEMKQSLISILYNDVSIGGRVVQVVDAMEEYLLAAIRFMSGEISDFVKVSYI